MKIIVRRGPWLVALLALVLSMTPKTGRAQWQLTGADCAFPASKRHFNCVADGRPVVDADLDLGKMGRAKLAVQCPGRTPLS